MGVFSAIPERAFALRSLFSVSARAAMRAIFYNGIVARLRLAFARHYGERSLQEFASVSSPGKEKARSDERA